MPCMGATGPVWGPTYHGRPWGGPCHRWGFRPRGRGEFVDRLERYAQEMREELAAVEVEIQELAPEKKGQ